MNMSTRYLGFDLPRLFVGSLGTLSLLGEALFRTRPLPPVERWLAGPADPRYPEGHPTIDYQRRRNW